ncbi:hypothetical protein JTB14_030413 [Gonioctena quinquepunctata]|nr:hypothetical protein JTB14_030413 [Gonioctena quinquepunctata]
MMMELLAAAEEAVVELANLPVDNEMITDEKQSNEDEYSEIKNVTTLLDEENLHNENTTYALEANTEMENNNSTEAPQNTFNTGSTYTDYFPTVLGPNTVKDIVYQSKLYATQRGKAMNFKEHELLAFLGLNFFMGYHTVPSYTHYWSCAEDLGIAIVKKVMPRSRFEQFLQYLHINDNSTLPPNNKDKIYKIRPFVITMNERFDILNNETRKLAVDESMIIFKGRSTLKQYNPSKEGTNYGA